MRYGVARRTLLVTAGIVWIIAGGNILRIGIVTWMSDNENWLFRVGEVIIVFLLFFHLVFKKLYYNIHDVYLKKVIKVVLFLFLM